MTRLVWRMTGVVILAGLMVGCQNEMNAGGKTPSAEEMEAAAATRAPDTGVMAPDFTLKDQYGKPFTLSDRRGQWTILYFYPKDDTPGCTCQATEFTELLFRFQNMNAAVIGINPGTEASHWKFSEKHHLKLRLLSDPDRKVLKEYGVSVVSPLAPDKPQTLRQTFLIGPDGRIRYHWAEVIPTGHAERVAAKLAELQAAEG